MLNFDSSFSSFFAKAFLSFSSSSFLINISLSVFIGANPCLFVFTRLFWSFSSISIVFAILSLSSCCSLVKTANCFAEAKSLVIASYLPFLDACSSFLQLQVANLAIIGTVASPMIEIPAPINPALPLLVCAIFRIFSNPFSNIPRSLSFFPARYNPKNSKGIKSVDATCVTIPEICCIAISVSSALV